MHAARSLALGWAALMLGALAPLACGGDDTAQAVLAADGGAEPGPVGDGAAPASDPVEAITISPADPFIEVLDGAIPSATTFVAKGTTKSGSTVDVTGTWSFDRSDVASLDASKGAFVATGQLGGKGTITFKAGTLTATTTATVKLHYTSNPQSLAPAIKQQFGAATTADPALKMLYPYDKTVFPRGLSSPTLQWNGGNADDVYYVHATSPTFEFEGWGSVPPPSRYDFPNVGTDIWTKLADSVDGDVTISVQRKDSTLAYLPMTRTWTIAPGKLTGAIYYEEIENGNVLRIRPGAAAPEDFLKKPDGVTCVGCHSAAKNSGTLAAGLNGSASPWGTFDTTNGAAIFAYGTDANDGPNGSGFQAISPTGTHVIWGQERQTAYLSLSPYNQRVESAKLNPGTGFPVHPAWSNDGKHIAFAVRTDGNWLDFNSASLWTTDVDLTGTTPSFTNTHKIVDADATRTCVTFPAYSPDSSWIAFEKSTQARMRGARVDLSLTSSDGATTIALDRANGSDVLAPEEASSSAEPNFMPVAAGGYNWVVFVSERTYGNILTNTAPNMRMKQLWISAIDANPAAGKDPSHSAFRLPGQRLVTNNIRGEWAQ